MNYHHIKTTYSDAVKLCMRGHYRQAKQPMKWVLANSRKYNYLHFGSGLALAGLYKKLSEYDFASRMLDYLLESYTDDNLSQAIVHWDLATVEHKRSNIRRAAKEASKADALFSDCRNSERFWYLLMLKGRYLSLCDRFEDAIDIEERAWAICEDSGSKYRVAQAITSIGDILLRMGDDQEGGKLCKKALLLASDFGAQFWIARNCLLLMQQAFKRGDLLEAKEYGKHCFRLAYNNGYRSTVEEACQSTGDYYAAIGDTEVADAFYQKAVNVGSESPDRVLEKVDRIYDTSYSKRKLNVKFNSTGKKWRECGVSEAPEGSGSANKVARYRYIIGSEKTKPAKTPSVGEKGGTTST